MEKKKNSNLTAAKKNKQDELKKDDDYYLKELRTDLNGWVKIEGVSNYWINKKGEVYFGGCVTGKIRRKSRFVTHTLLKIGYYKINMDHKRYFLHRVIAQTFIPNPNNLPEVDHIDRNPQNNDISNLRWVTHKENLNNPNTRKRQSEAHMGNKGYWKVPIYAINKNKVKVICKNENNEIAKTFDMIKDCIEYFNISYCIFYRLVKKHVLFQNMHFYLDKSNEDNKN